MTFCQEHTQNNPSLLLLQVPECTVSAISCFLIVLLMPLFAILAHVRYSHQYYVGKILTVSYDPLFPVLYKLLTAALNLQR